MFSFCYFGQNITDQFAEFGDTIYQSEWYSFPNEVMQLLPFFMNATQKPVVLRGFGNVSCTRESFRKVNYIKY